MGKKTNMGRGLQVLFKALEFMKISFITTVFNEEENILKLLESLKKQTKRPDEIIICDGGSTDNTLSAISNFQFLPASRQVPTSNQQIKVLFKKGNRSVGRNEAIKNATGDIIVCSDAGCILDKDWVKNIVEPFKNKNIDVVAGYYKGLSKNIFQKCLVPYVLVMPDRLNSQNFLPASRSMAFRKKVWEESGGFPEQFSDNEDYVFARILKGIGARIVFVKEATVSWMPRKNLTEAFIMFYRFAKGDSQAGIIRPKVILIFVRYLIATILFAWNTYALLLLLIVYLEWSVQKNYRYAKDIRAVGILPILQILSDIAVLSGTVRGILNYGIQK
jgi:glycosyltransferase involved in cell wall biosynthesis